MTQGFRALVADTSLRAANLAGGSVKSRLEEDEELVLCGETFPLDARLDKCPPTAGFEKMGQRREQGSSSAPRTFAESEELPRWIRGIVNFMERVVKQTGLAAAADGQKSGSMSLMFRVAAVQELDNDRRAACCIPSTPRVGDSKLFAKVFANQRMCIQMPLGLWGSASAERSLTFQVGLESFATQSGSNQLGTR